MDACSSGPVLFLCHAGADVEVALELALARRLGAAPASRQSEVRVALSRAVNDDSYLFVPILVGGRKLALARHRVKANEEECDDLGPFRGTRAYTGEH